MTQARIIIVSRTRMKNGNICVGAYDVDNRRSIRLFNSFGNPHTSDFPLQIGHVVTANYINKAVVTAPHVEDVIMQSYADTPDKEDARKRFFESAVLQTGPITNCFQGKLRQPQGSALGISRADTSDHSVCFWQSDAPLILNRFGKYDYRSGTIRATIGYVGIPDPIQTIAKGRVIRLSLSRWWAANDAEQHCWLQISGWY